MRRIRILLAKGGLDGHDRGILVVAMACRESGMEVIYGGLHLKPTEIASIAIQEGVDVIGISSLSGAHLTIATRTIEELKKKGAEHIPVIIGGFIPPEDISELRASGVAGVFGSDTKLDSIIDSIRSIVGVTKKAEGELNGSD